MPKRPVLTVNEVSFGRKVLQRSRPVVGGFSSRTCGACAMYDPEFERALHPDFTGAKFAKIVAEDPTGLFPRCLITATPAAVLFRGGGQVARQQGAQDAPRLLAWMRRRERASPKKPFFNSLTVLYVPIP